MSEEFRIVWTDSALHDVENIIEYIAAQGNPLNAQQVHDKLVSAVEKLKTHPRRCRIVPEMKSIGVGEYRELIVNPHRICFGIHGRDIVLVAVLDGRRQVEELLIERALGL